MTDHFSEPVDISPNLERDEPLRPIHWFILTLFLMACAFAGLYELIF